MRLVVINLIGKPVREGGGVNRGEKATVMELETNNAMKKNATDHRK